MFTVNYLTSTRTVHSAITKIFAQTTGKLTAGSCFSTNFINYRDYCRDGFLKTSYSSKSRKVYFLFQKGEEILCQFSDGESAI